jgi:dipeptidyl-peptidase-4
MRASLLFLLVSTAAFGQRKPITLAALEEIGRLAPTGGRGNPLAWAPDGTRFVYRQGTRLMTFDAATQASNELTDLDKLPTTKAQQADAPQPFEWQNRRVSESPVQWSSDGNKILYATGGELFLIDVQGGAAKSLQVTSVRDPKLSPDGRSVAFINDWDLYTLDLASGKKQRLTSNGSYTLRNGAPDWVYPEELDLGSGYWWSPDSKSIAYLRFDTSGEGLYPHADLRNERALAEPQRYPQAGERNPDVRLGVVSARGGATKWFDTGNTVWEYLLARVTWTPDAKRLFVVRTNRVQSKLELLAYDVESRKASPILEESDLYWVNVLDEPRFFTANPISVYLKSGAHVYQGTPMFLWLSERDGFQHIYLYPETGGVPVQLTKGAWNVTSINGVNEAEGIIYFTPGEGTHSIAMSPRAKYFLHSASSTTSPPRVTLHEGGGRELAVYRDADRRVMDQYNIVPTELGSFRGPDGSLLYTRLIKPVGFDPAKKYPGVVQVYGGPGAQGPRNSWYGADFDQVLANAGFVVWQVDNRGSAGRGHAFEIPLFRNMGPVELADQVAGVKQLVSMGFVDPARVGVRGWSYGGFMTLNALLNAPDTFKAGAAGAPVTNWRNYDTIYTERYMGLPEANADGYKNTALPQKASNLKGSLMILHNFEDDNVLFQNSLQMIDALERAGKQFDLVLYTQKTHGVTGPEARHVDAAMLGFFEKALK